MNKSEIITRLESSGRWVTQQAGNAKELVICRSYGGKAIKMTMVRVVDGLWEVRFPSYLFDSRVSHFRSVEPEERFCQNKGLLFSTVRCFKKAGIWEEIANKRFFEVNESNRKSKKSKLRSSLEELLGS